MGLLGRFRNADRNVLAAGGIVLAIVFFVSLNLLATATTSSMRIDLTADRIFTISKGTREVLKSIKEPITLRYYVSKGLNDLGPPFTTHAERVSELLDEYARIADGKLIIKRYQPTPYSPEEDMALADGIRGVSLGEDNSDLYFGLAGSNSTDDTKAIPYLAPQRDNFLEYDLTRLVNSLAHPKKPVVGVLGDLPITGTRQDGFQSWAVVKTMEESFDVHFLDINGAVTRIPDDVKVLLLTQPRSLDKAALYAIDQYVMRGGRVLAFIDPFAETMAGRGSPLQNPGGGAIETMEPLLSAWGVKIDKDKVVADREASLRVRYMHDGRPVVTDYPVWMSLDKSHFAGNDVTLGSLQEIQLRSPGAISARKGATTRIEPLLTSSDVAETLDVSKIAMQPDPAQIMADFKATGKRYVFAARVTGPVKSAFPDGPPAEAKKAVEKSQKSGKKKSLPTPYLAKAKVPLNLILVADTDLLADDAWVRTEQLLGRKFTVPTANNGDFAYNALDNLAGSEALIGLRGKGLTPRPFEVLDAKRRQAEDQYRATEQELIKKISAAQKKIKALQQKEGTGGEVMTAAQQKEIDKFRDEMLTLRKRLRDVKFALRKDVDSLKTRIRLADIWAMPIIIALIAIGLAIYRRWRASHVQARSAERRAG